MKDRLWSQAVCAEEIDKVGRSEVQENVLETEEDGEENATQEQSRLVPRKGYGENEYPVEETIVLVVDMVDDEQTWRKKYRERSSMREMFVWLGGILDVSGASMLVYSCPNHVVS